MHNWRKRLGIALLVLIAAAQLVRPARINPVAEPSRRIHARLEVPADVAAILDRSCRDCHSNQTRWPWYSSVAPVSWWVIDHVNHGRSHFNYSEWATYDRKQAENLLEHICEEVRSGAMPLPPYLPMHPQARFSPADVARLCEWSQVQRQRLSGDSRPGG